MGILYNNSALECLTFKEASLYGIEYKKRSIQGIIRFLENTATVSVKVLTIELWVVGLSDLDRFYWDRFIRVMRGSPAFQKLERLEFQIRCHGMIGSLVEKAIKDRLRELEQSILISRQLCGLY